MVRDHTSVNDQATALAKKLNLTREESATSRGLKADADKEATKLKGLNGAAFDKAYIDNEVAYHERVLGAVDDSDPKREERRAQESAGKRATDLCLAP